MRVGSLQARPKNEIPTGRPEINPAVTLIFRIACDGSGIRASAGYMVAVDQIGELCRRRSYFIEFEGLDAGSRCGNNEPE
jgi:hypothetical protein